MFLDHSKNVHLFIPIFYFVLPSDRSLPKVPERTSPVFTPMRTCFWHGFRDGAAGRVISVIPRRAMFLYGNNQGSVTLDADLWVSSTCSSIFVSISKESVGKAYPRGLSTNNINNT